MLFAYTLAGFLALTAVLCTVLPWLSPKVFNEQRQDYINKHQTLGCRVTHMFGVPMLALSFPFLVLGWQWFLGLFVVGSILQLAGHYVFEGNSPVLATGSRNRFTIVYAVIFVVEEWVSLFTGKSFHK